MQIVVGFLAIVVAAAHRCSAPPFFEITATSLYDAGVQNGRFAAERIHGWFRSAEMRTLFEYAAGKGKANFTRLKQKNAEAFPQYTSEMQGIAEGAQIAIDQIWVANLIGELEGLMGKHPDGPSLVDSRPEPLADDPGHCSDIYAVSEGGFSHGHNEDWSVAVEPFWYFVKYIPAPGANFSGGAGMVYPGSLFGWAASWNSKGVYITQNSLYPKGITSDGFAAALVQRDALDKGDSVDTVATALTTGGMWSSGASVNIVDVRARRMANVEVFHNIAMVTEVTDAMGNFSHFNVYKTLSGNRDVMSASTLHRQTRVDALPPPRTLSDIAAVLSDTKDRAFPIFRNVTISTLLIDGVAGRLDIWCCGNAPVGGARPAFTVDLLDFSRTPSRPIYV